MWVRIPPDKSFPRPLSCAVSRGRESRLSGAIQGHLVRQFLQIDWRSVGGVFTVGSSCSGRAWCPRPYRPHRFRRRPASPESDNGRLFRSLLRVPDQHHVAGLRAAGKQQVAFRRPREIEGFAGGEIRYRVRFSAPERAPWPNERTIRPPSEKGVYQAQSRRHEQTGISRWSSGSVDSTDVIDRRSICGALVSPMNRVGGPIEEGAGTQGLHQPYCWESIRLISGSLRSDCNNSPQVSLIAKAGKDSSIALASDRRTAGTSPSPT